MTKIITANFMIWKSMDLQTNSRTKHPRKYVYKKKLKCDHNCTACKGTCKIYNPHADSYHKCRRCEQKVKDDYDWFD
jgi:hypothetical protein